MDESHKHADGEEAKYKRVHIVWFYLYIISKQAKGICPVRNQIRGYACLLGR